MSLIEKARPRSIDDEETQRPRRRRRRLLLLLLTLVGALAALWWLRVDELVPEPGPAEAPLAPPPVATEQAPLGSEHAPAEAVEAAPPAPAPEQPLPPRAESDAFARELASRVSSHPLFLAALKEAGVIDRFVVTVDQLAEGKVPRRELRSFRPRGSFLVLGGLSARRIDPASYRRYDGLAAAIASLDARAAADAYRRVEPLCEESYRALGYPEGGFEQRMHSALALLLSTPLLDEDPALIQETKRYEFADAELESLSDAQKQLLRMGPTNAKRVIAKLRELDTALRP